ncbi:unnamed protein product [Parajaminaea phylloscopi]
MNLGSLLSDQLLRQYEDRQKVVETPIQSRPIELGRLVSATGQPFGGYQPSEMAQDSFHTDRNGSFELDAGVDRSRANWTNQSHGNAWASHPALAARTRSESVMPSSAIKGEKVGSVLSNPHDTSEMKPVLGWYEDEPGEQALRQLATMQARLNQRLGPEYVTSRAGPGGTKLWYVEGWKAIDLANDVFGFNGWSTSVIRLDTDFIDTNSNGTSYNLGITAIVRITLRDGTFHEDVGYGRAENAKCKGTGLEKAKKEAVTDAVKRTLRTFGRVMGNCVYDKKFTDGLKKMKAEEPKFDPAHLLRRTDVNVPPPPPEAYLHTTTADVSVDNASMSSDTSLTKPPSPSVTNENIAGTSAVGGLKSADGGDVHIQRQKRREEALRKQRALAAQNQNGPPKDAAITPDSPNVQQVAPGSVSAPRPTPPPLSRAPPAAVPAPPKSRVMPTEPAAQAYARDPGARWSKPVSAQEPQCVNTIPEDDLQAVVNAFDLSQSNEAPAMVKLEKVDSPATVKRAGSAGRFISVQSTEARSADLPTDARQQRHPLPQNGGSSIGGAISNGAATEDGRASKRPRQG